MFVLALLAQAEAEGSIYHSSKVVTTAGTDLQTIGSDVVYVGRAETRIKLHKKDKAALGITVARLKENGGLPTSVSTPPLFPASSSC